MELIKKSWGWLKENHAPITTLIAFAALIWSISLSYIHQANIKEITKRELSIEISDLETRMSSFVEGTGEMVLDETVRKIVASHGNIQRARDDTYKKALDEALEGDYIFEINQAPGGVGHDVFVTDDLWRPGKADKKGSSSLLTIEEKADLEKYLKIYFAKEKNEKQKDGFANEDTQREIFFFLLAESDIGCITESPKRQISRQTAYREKIEVLTPFAKLGAVIGYIGDEMENYERGF